MNKVKVPLPKGVKTVAEKLDFYDKLIQNGLGVEELKIVKRRLGFIDAYFEDVEVITKKEIMLQCIQEMLDES